jgi:hypothetical protein
MARAEAGGAPVAAIAGAEAVAQLGGADDGLVHPAEHLLHRLGAGLRVRNVIDRQVEGLQRVLEELLSGPRCG